MFCHRVKSEKLELNTIDPVSASRLSYSTGKMNSYFILISARERERGEEVEPKNDRLSLVFEIRLTEEPLESLEEYRGLARRKQRDKNSLVDWYYEWLCTRVIRREINDLSDYIDVVIQLVFRLI